MNYDPLMRRIGMDKPPSERKCREHCYHFVEKRDCQGRNMPNPCQQNSEQRCCKCLKFKDDIDGENLAKLLPSEVPA